MRRFSTICILSFLLSNISIGQNVERRLNLIVVIDNKIVVGGMLNPQLRSGDNYFPVRYEPGNLTITDTNNVLTKIDSLPVILSFYYNVYNKRDLAYSNDYEIPLNKAWLEQSFIILRIYNTDRKPYKKIYYPLKGLNYTFELDLPTGSINRVTKKPSV
jgi:hypothetical protein